MNDLNPFLRIIVSDHATLRAEQRLGYRVLDEDVRAEVRIGIFTDRATQVRPHWTHGDGRARETDDEPGSWYVYDKDATRCWVVVPSGGATVVKTLLLSAEEETRLASTRHVRSGQVRR